MIVCLSVLVLRQAGDESRVYPASLGKALGTRDASNIQLTSINLIIPSSGVEISVFSVTQSNSSHPTLTSIYPCAKFI